jgi:Phosphoglycerate dehydrogenase and related dehydrogenases
MIDLIISDHINEKCIEILKKKGINVHYLPEITQDELKKSIVDKHAIILRGRTKLNREILENAKHLRLIVRAGVGLDNIDLNFAKERGIEVRNTPAAPSKAVAELTIALIISLLRELYKAYDSMKKSKWLKKELIGSEISSKTIGIFGFGRIGYEVAKRLKNFGCRIIAYDIDPTRQTFANELRIEFTTNMDYVLKQSDIITIHIPLIESTKNLFSYETLIKMKRGSYIVNVSRGEVLDEGALLKLIKEGHIKGAALDVFSNEPPNSEIEKELLRDDRVIATPHIGAQTVETMEAEAIEAAEIVIRFFNL